MSLDPRDYDLAELQRPGADPVERATERASEPLAGGSLRADQYRELLLLQNGRRGVGLDKPYLTSLPGTYDGELVTFEWLEFLVAKGGFKRAYDALRHYRAVGWLTGDVEQELRDYLAGIPEMEPGVTRPFDQSDHLQSLIYIGRLATD